MTFAILIIGFACIVYAQRARKDEMDFKEILDNSDFEIENSESFPLDNGVAYVDIKNMEKKLELFEEKLELFEEKLEIFKTSEESMGEKIESMEGVLGELTGIAYCKRSSGKINTKKTAELNLADKDFYKRSMEELSADTGLNKGELLLIKRLSKK